MAKYKNGNVYFIKDKVTGYIKIGWTTNVNRRMKQFRTSNLNLELIYVLENSTMLVEQSLHNYFESERVGLEWYQPHLVNQWIERDRLTKEVMKQEGII
jgi:hypothetical protein